MDNTIPNQQEEAFSQLYLDEKEKSLLEELEITDSSNTKKLIKINHDLGVLFVKTDIDKSIGYFRSAANLGSVDDMFNCGYFSKQNFLILQSENDENAQKYRQIAKKYYKLAIKNDHKKSIINFLKWYIDENNKSKAINYLLGQINEKSVNLMTILAEELENDDKIKSLELYKKAADNCRKNEAMRYADQIIEKNLPEAMIYYKVSVSKGSVNACFRLASIFKSNSQPNIAIEYLKCAILILDRKTEKPNDKDIANRIKAHYKIGKLYFKQYQETIKSDPSSAMQFVKLAEFYFWPIYEKNKKAAQFLFSIIELQKDELSHQTYINYIYKLGLSGAAGAVQIYFNETKDYKYIEKAIDVNADDPFTNYICGVHENDMNYIKKASELGYPEASYDYGVYLLSNFEFQESLQFINYAYQKGISKAGAILGIIYLNNWIEDDNGKEKALEFLEKAKDDNERANFLFKEIKTGQIPQRNSSLYSVFH